MSTSKAPVMLSPDSIIVPIFRQKTISSLVFILWRRRRLLLRVRVLAVGKAIKPLLAKGSVKDGMPSAVRMPFTVLP